MKSKESPFFWPSFTDLMISLFFIMMVLYVLTYLKLKTQQKASEDQLKKIQEIQAAVKELPEKFFTYDSVYKRFSMNRTIEFPDRDDRIPASDESYLVNVGEAISALIDTLKLKYAAQDIRYVILIEGMASKDSYPDNFQLSYRRALSLVRLWEKRNINLDQDICEIQIAGSGVGGIGRALIEKQNQRILIHVIPKIGQIRA